MKHRKPSINHTESNDISVNYTTEAEPRIDDTEEVVTDQGQVFTVGEIKHSKRIIKSATPKGDISWYIKWASSIIVLFAVTIRASGVLELHVWDVLLSWLGAVGWFVVGFMWKDRALILLNGVISIMLFAGLLKIMFGA